MHGMQFFAALLTEPHPLLGASNLAALVLNRVSRSINSLHDLPQLR